MYFKNTRCMHFSNSLDYFLHAFSYSKFDSMTHTHTVCVCVLRVYICTSFPVQSLVHKFALVSVLVLANL